jgi:Fic family protein
LGVPPHEVKPALANFDARLADLLKLLDSRIPVHSDLDRDQLSAVIEACAWAHAEWIRIHPFANGNGRTARLLNLMLLYHHNYEVGRFISLERVIEDSKETYYDSLEASSQGWHEGTHDPLPWLEYSWGVLIRAYEEFQSRADMLRAAPGLKTEQIRQVVEKRKGPFTATEIHQDCPGVGRDMVRYVLRKLRDQGIVHTTGRGRGRKWIRNRL